MSIETRKSRVVKKRELKNLVGLSLYHIDLFPMHISRMFCYSGRILDVRGLYPRLYCQSSALCCILPPNTAGLIPAPLPPPPLLAIKIVSW
jgi:hypothetical protein